MMRCVESVKFEVFSGGETCLQKALDGGWVMEMTYRSKMIHGFLMRGTSNRLG